MNKNARLPESERGTEVFSVDPLIFRWHQEIDYLTSYGPDTPFFLGLAEGKLLGSHCLACDVRYATPRSHCMQCGGRTEWFELPLAGAIHTYTTCYYTGEEFLKETPFHLILVEFPGVDTLFLSRLIGVEANEIQIGLPVRARFRRLSQFNVTDVYFVPA
jgi:uncharacterized OB-fold protein